MISKTLLFSLSTLATHAQLLNGAVNLFAMAYIQNNTNFNPSISHLVPGAKYTPEHFTSPFECSNLVYACSARKTPQIINKDSPNYLEDKPAMGFETEGILWAIICYDTPYGNVAGKASKNNLGHYPWGGYEHECKSYNVVFGELIFHTAPLPDSCSANSFQTNDKQYYYNAVVVSKHGMIPGKGDRNLQHAWYSYGGVEYFVEKNFYIIC